MADTGSPSSPNRRSLPPHWAQAVLPGANSTSIRGIWSGIGLRLGLSAGVSSGRRSLAVIAAMDDLDMEPFELTGLYDGTPLTQKSSFDQPEGPDTVWLFRRPILDEWAERGNVTLTELVAHVTIHEFAHHFGWSDADIARIDAWWE